MWKLPSNRHLANIYMWPCVVSSTQHGVHYSYRERGVESLKMVGAAEKKASILHACKLIVRCLLFAELNEEKMQNSFLHSHTHQFNIMEKLLALFNTSFRLFFSWLQQQ